MVPEAIGRYRVLRRVGAGGMGVVYEAVDEDSGARVALKVLMPHAAESKEGLLRFKREFRALARLRHPHVVEVLDAGIEDDIPFIAMEFVVGKDIRRYIGHLPAGPVRERELVRCVRELLGALGHIHARMIVHRDLKPENIMVGEDGRVKLMDFGVAQVVRTEAKDGLLGTFAYMSPEQVRGEHLDGRADLYAVGVLIYELLVGKYPFPVEPPAAALHHHVHSVPDRIEDHVPNVDVRLAELARRLLEKEPLLRVPSAAEAAALLGAPAPTTSPALFHPRPVGRQVELSQLRRWAEEAQDGLGRMVLVEGPTGIGKTWLIDGFVAGLDRPALRAQCTSELGPAFGVLEGLFDEVASILDQSAPAVARRILGDDAGLLLPVSAQLAQLAPIAGAPPSPSEPHERKVALKKAMVGVLGRLALARPLVVVLEDMQWADLATLEFLRDLSRTLFAPRPGGSAGETVCPLLVVLTRCSLADGVDAAEALVRRLERKGRIERLRLGPLDRRSVGQLLESMSGAAQPPEAIIDELFRVTLGRPLLVRETVEAWTRDGVLHRSHGQWWFRGVALGEAVGLHRPRRPRPVRGDEAGLVRLRTLLAPTRSFVERVALLGRLVPARLAAAVSGASEEAFLDAVDEAVRAGLLVEDVAKGGVQYRFEHEGFRETVASSLGPERRRRLHGEIGERLERDFRSRRRAMAHVLSRHFRAGPHPERAVRYLELAAAEAERRGDLEGASRRLGEAERLLEAAPRTPARGTRRVRIRSAEIDLLLDFGQVESALDRADPALAADARRPRVASAMLGVRRAAALFGLGRAADCLACLADLPKPYPTAALGARAHELEGRARLGLGEGAAATYALEEARRLADRAGLEGLAERIEAKLAVVGVERSDPGAALERLEAAMALARRRGDDRTVVELLGHIGVLQSRRGNGSEARASLRAAIEWAEARGDAWELERWTGELGRQLADLGDREGAQRCLRRALALAQKAGHEAGVARWQVEIGLLELALGDIGSATETLRSALAQSERLGHATCAGFARVALAAAVGGSAAREHLEAALSAAERDKSAELEVLALIGLSGLEPNGPWLRRAERRALAAHDLRLLRRVRLARPPER